MIAVSMQWSCDACGNLPRVIRPPRPHSNRRPPSLQVVGSETPAYVAAEVHGLVLPVGESSVIGIGPRQ